MKHSLTRLDLLRTSIAIFFVVVVVGLLTMPACGPKPVNLSPAGQQAFVNTEVIHALDLIRDTATNGNAQTPPLISTATTRAIVKYHESALNTIHATPNGWKETVTTGLDEVKKDLPPTEVQILGPYFDLAKTLFDEVTQ